jgi:hypothetical protein
MVRLESILSRGFPVLTCAPRGFIAVLFLLLVCTAAASAQSFTVSGYFAGGTAIATSAGPLDTYGLGTVYSTPRMGGFFETFGGDVIVFHGLGVGAEATWRRGKAPYAGLLYHPDFYDVNAVYRPFTFAHRFEPEFQAGWGKADLKTYFTQQLCDTLPQGCPTGVGGLQASTSVTQIHFAAGVRGIVFKGVFLRPQVDVRHASDDFRGYFGSPWITQVSVAIGYSYHHNHEAAQQ